VQKNCQKVLLYQPYWPYAVVDSAAGDAEQIPLEKLAEELAEVEEAIEDEPDPVVDVEEEPLIVDDVPGEDAGMLEVGGDGELEIVLGVEEITDAAELLGLDVIDGLLAGDEEITALDVLELLVVDRVEVEPGSGVRAAP
jgi:hypothetical protein